MAFWDGTRWVPESSIKARADTRPGRSPSAGLIMLIALLTLALTAVPVFAGKGGNGKGGAGKPGGGGNLTLMVLDPDDGGANFGEQVTFEVSTTATDQPMVQVDCYQAGAHVYWASAGFYASYPWPWATNFTLRSSYWTGGAANCTATLYMFDGRRYQNLTSIAFDVAA